MKNKLKKIPTKIFKLIIFLIFIILSPFIVFIIRVATPFLLIRLQHVRVNRIGHLSTNIELYLCEKDNNINVPSQKYLDIFFYDRKICNYILFNKWKKKVFVFPGYIIKPIYYFNNLNFIKNNKYLIKPGEQFHDTHDIHNLLDISKIHLTFTKNEINIGENFLKNCGLDQNDKFICLIVRDNAYLNSIGSQYHSHRDCDINNFVLAAENLTKLGYYVFRMGAIVNKKIKSKNSKIIDYATNGMRTELLDLYLLSKCEFCISTSLGLDSVIDIFRKPMIITNFLPFGDLRHERNNVITIFKHHFSEDKNKNLTMKEINDLGIGYSYKKNDFDKKGIKLIENNEKEIYDATLDLLYLLKNKNFDQKSLNFVNKFNSKFYELFYDKKMNTKIKTTIAPSFLKNNFFLID